MITMSERLIAFLNANPYTIHTAQQIALLLGVNKDEVKRELDCMARDKWILAIQYPGGKVYRYVPRTPQPLRQ